MNQVSGTCPVCDAEVALSSDAHVSEVVSCSDCKSKLVVKSLVKGKAVLAKAPEVEEDWGE